MELDPRSAERLPFHDADEAVGAHAGEIVPARDAQTRHLRRVTLCSGCDEDERGRVAEISKIVEVPEGTAITRVGDAGDSFFVIIDGMAAVRTPVGSGNQLGAGAGVGGGSLLDGEPRSATIVAASDIRLLSVDRSHFWQLLDANPELIRRLLTVPSPPAPRL